MTGKTSTALVCRTSGSQNEVSLVLDHVSLPQLESHQVLVRVSFVAQNPTDVQCFDWNSFGDGAVLGCDFSGIIEEIGDGVTRVKKGDRIAALIWGGEIKGLGAYSEYTIADEKICFLIPENMSGAPAATVPLALTTSWLALFSKNCLSIDRSSGQDTSVLIWGGSSSVGLYAIQIARIYNFKVATVCSPKHFDLCEKLGATYVFDYRSSSVTEDIVRVLPNIAYVYDCIGSPGTSAKASNALRSEGGTLCTVRPGRGNTENVQERTKVTDVFVWNAFLKEHRYGAFFWPADADDHALSTELFEKLAGWSENGTIVPNETKIFDEGLEDVRKGFQMYRDGKISGFKIVYKL